MAAITLLQLMFLAGPLPEPAEIQQAGLAARKMVVSGDMEFEIYDGLPLKDAPHDIDWKLNVRDRLIFDTRPAWSAYLERWQPGEPVFLKNGEQLIQRAPGGGHRLRIVLSPIVCLQFVPDRLTGGIWFDMTSDDPQSDPIEAKIVMHPWRFGLIPENFGIQYDVDIKDLGKFIAAPRQADVTIDEDRELGFQCWRVSYRDDEGRTVTTWFDRSRGMNVCKVAKSGDCKYGTFVSSATSKLKHYPTAGIWYPDEIYYRSVVDGDEMDGSFEKLVVRRAEFNVEIDPKQFTAKALEAPPETLIVSRKREPGPTKMWDGEQVSPVTEGILASRFLRPKMPMGRIFATQFLVVAGAILLLLVVIIGLTQKSRT